jgi:hypothetical protein
MKSRVLHDVKKRGAHLGSPERVYQAQTAEMLMDGKALSSAFDYTSLESIFEKKQILKAKLILVE